MNSDEFNRVEQAVFGYSNGHRLLASSITLSPMDSYELAAASDLAPGAQLQSDQSYLTGLLLPQSKMYALIRTWLAPEMARPGCVWSHVLMLRKDVLSSQADLTTLNRMFRRPGDYRNDETFSIGVSISRRAKGSPASRQVIEKVLVACYEREPLSLEPWTEDELEAAIMAVWSQQWPRLRTAFSFRSIPSTADFRGQSFHFRSTHMKSIGFETKRWVEEAAKDAVSATITPLRRFLWRYGKDFDARSHAFPFLIDMYLKTRNGTLDVRVAESAFEYLKSGQGETLKRDMLGLGRNKLSYVPKLTHFDLVSLLSRVEKVRVDHEVPEIVFLFSDVEADELPALISTVYASADGLGYLAAALMDTLIPLVEVDTLLRPQLPKKLVAEILRRRVDLINPSTCTRISSEHLTGLAQTDIPLEKLNVVLGILLRSEMNAEASAMVETHTAQVFIAGVGLYQEGSLSDSWLNLFRNRSQMFVGYIELVEHGDELAAAADLLDYPDGDLSNVVRWHAQLRKAGASASNDAQSTLMAYVLALSVPNGIENARAVLRDIVPELRTRILNNELSDRARRLLDSSLPIHKEGWDLNRRLLKLFRNGYKRGQHFDDVLEGLLLTDKEYAYATNQNDEAEPVRRMLKVWLPWMPWD